MACALAGALAAVLAGCGSGSAHKAQDTNPDLHAVAAFADHAVGGVAVSQDGRVFVSFPYWTQQHHISLARLSGGRAVPFPDGRWNHWRPADGDAASRFVDVHGLYLDGQDRLWALDSGRPPGKDVVPGGAKLVEMDPDSGRVLHVYHLPAALTPPGSDLVNVRVDTTHQAAYMSDTGLGAIVVLDLSSGHGRRVLDDVDATRATPGFVLHVDGHPVRRRNGRALVRDVDGLALSPQDRYLYFHALNSDELYRIQTVALLDNTLSRGERAHLVEDLGRTVACDGMAMGPDGTLYLADPQRDAVLKYSSDFGLQRVVRDPRLQWPDSLALGPHDGLYVSASQFQDSPLLGHEGFRTQPYRLFRFPLARP